MGIQVQPCCCGKKSIYASAYKASGFYRDAALDWTYNGLSSGSLNFGFDVDLKNGFHYASWRFGEIWRIRTSDRGGAVRILERTPKTAVKRLNEFRVFPDKRILLFAEVTTGFTPADPQLNLLNLDTLAVTTVDTFSNPGAGNTHSACINLATDRVVFLALTYVGPRYDQLLRDCSLTGTGTTTLATIDTNIISTELNFTFADVDYANNKYWFVEHRSSSASGARRVMRCNWDGSGMEAVFDSNDVLPWFTGSLFGGNIESLGFADGQIFENKIHFRGDLFRTTGSFEKRWFEANLDGSELRAILRPEDFPAPMSGAVDSSEIDGVVWGDGFDDRRGRLP